MPMDSGSRPGTGRLGVTPPGPPSMDDVDLENAGRGAVGSRPGLGDDDVSKGTGELGETAADDPAAPASDKGLGAEDDDFDLDDAGKGAGDIAGEDFDFDAGKAGLGDDGDDLDVGTKSADDLGLDDDDELDTDGDGLDLGSHAAFESDDELDLDVDVDDTPGGRGGLDLGEDDDKEGFLDEILPDLDL